MLKRVFLPVLLCLAGAARAAFTIEPALVNIQANMGEKSAWVQIVHTGGPPMAIEVVVLERQLDIDGEIDRAASVKSADFMVYPSEVILYPNEKVNMQVIYKGKQKFTADKSYFLFSKEVPLPIEEEGGDVRMGVNMLMNYYTVLAVNTGKPGKLTFVSSKAAGNGTVEVVVENKSGGRVAGDGLSITVGGKKIPSFTGAKNSIMPGQKRRFTFKHPKPPTAREINFGY